MEDFCEKIYEAVCGFKMEEEFADVAVALSGGADSVSLLRALESMQKQLDIRVCACHLNHSLRGAESDRDEEFCKSLCGKLHIPIIVKTVDVRSIQNKHESVEAAARRARYTFFDEVRERTGGIIATAHTASDNAETVLLNLLRGTGLRGICGIPPRRGGIIRPLLHCTREDVERYLETIGQEYVTDNTNLCADYTRNKLRMEVIPRLEEINPAFLTVITRMCEAVRADSAYLEQRAERELSRAESEQGYDASMLAQLPEPIKSRAVRKILEDGGVEPSALRINTAKGLLNRRRARFNPCKNRYFTIRRGIAYVEKVEQQIKISAKYHKN